MLSLPGIIIPDLFPSYQNKLTCPYKVFCMPLPFQSFFVLHLFVACITITKFKTNIWLKTCSYLFVLSSFSTAFNFFFSSLVTLFEIKVVLQNICIFLSCSAQYKYAFAMCTCSLKQQRRCTQEMCTIIPWCP